MALVGDAAKGSTAFNQSCTACHGPDGTGVEGLGKDLVTSEFAIGMPDAEQEELLRLRDSEGLPDEIVRQMQHEIDVRIRALGT